jgi:hypothetical protein
LVEDHRAVTHQEVVEGQAADLELAMVAPEDFREDLRAL